MNRRNFIRNSLGVLLLPAVTLAAAPVLSYGEEVRDFSRKFLDLELSTTQIAILDGKLTNPPRQVGYSTAGIAACLHHFHTTGKRAIYWSNTYAFTNFYQFDHLIQPYRKKTGAKGLLTNRVHASYLRAYNPNTLFVMDHFFYTNYCDHLVRFFARNAQRVITNHPII